MAIVVNLDVMLAKRKIQMTTQPILPLKVILNQKPKQSNEWKALKTILNEMFGFIKV